MFTSHLADRPVCLFATPSVVLAQACSPDRNQAGIGADQALGTEPCQLECLPHLQAEAILASDHPLLHRQIPLVGATDERSTRMRRREIRSAVEHARSCPSTQRSSWQLCTAGHHPAPRQHDKALLARLAADHVMAHAME